MQQNTGTNMEEDTGLLGGTTEAELTKPTGDDEPIMVNVREEAKQEIKLDRPDDLPVELWDDEAGNFKTQNLYEEYKKEKARALGLRQTLSKGGLKPPESPDMYTIDLETLNADLGVTVDEDDAGIMAFKNAAFSNGLDQGKFESILKDYMTELSKMDPQEAAQTPEEAAEKSKEYIDTEMKKLGPNAAGVIQGIKTWNQQLYYDGLLSESDFKVAQNMGMSADEIRVLNIYRTAAGNLTIPEVARQIDGQPSEQEINKILSDPAYETDPVLQKKVSDYFESKYK